MQWVWVLAVCGWWVQWAAGEDSMCQSEAYRGLPVAVQNEHQCMVLDRLQQDAQAHKLQADNHFSQLISRISKMEHSLSRKLSRRGHRSNLNEGTGFPSLKGVPVARDCHELWMSGIHLSGVYAVKLPSGRVLNVYCDMDSDGGGWTLIQRRVDGSLNFTRGWDDYAFGFGNVNSEFWLGNDNLHSLTRDTNYTLRVDLWDWEGQHAYAEYSFMRVSGEDEDFKLTLGSYNGTAGDSLSYHSGMRFTTPDRDHDRWWANCGQKDQSGWWFNACSYSSLNGVYQQLGRAAPPAPSPDGTHTGIQWFHWKADPTYSLQRVTMRLKPRVAVLLEGLGRLPDPVYG